jgi:hypothetical protein
VTSLGGHDADDGTNRTRPEAFDLRIVYDKVGERLPISATLTAILANVLRTGMERLCGLLLALTGHTLSLVYPNSHRFWTGRDERCKFA